MKSIFGFDVSPDEPSIAVPDQPVRKSLFGFDVPHDEPSESATATRGFVGGIADLGLTAAKGAIGVPEAIVGIADLLTFGHAGKLAEEAGFRPKEAKALLDQYYTPAQQAANEAVKVPGFFATIKAALQNPSTILHSAVESAPSMLGGAGVAREFVKRAPGIISPLVAGAIGEGVVTAGQNTEQLRQETPDGLLTGSQSALMVGSGALTGAIGFAGGRLAKKLGIADIDTWLAGGGSTTALAKQPGLLKRVSGGILSEGIFEELPQSAQEAIAQNVALGKPWDEGVGNQAAMGMLVGGVMGGGANILPGRQEAVPAPPAQPKVETPADLVAGVTLILNTGSVGEAVAAANQVVSTSAAPVTAPAFTTAQANELVRGARNQQGDEAIAQAEDANAAQVAEESRVGIGAGLRTVLPAQATPGAEPTAMELAMQRAREARVAKDQAELDDLIRTEGGDALYRRMQLMKPQEAPGSIEAPAPAQTPAGEPVAQPSPIPAVTAPISEETVATGQQEEARPAHSSAEPATPTIAGKPVEQAEIDRRALPAVKEQLFAQWGDQSHPVDSIEDASRKWEAFRDKSGAGVSEVGNGVVVVDQTGKEVALVSYNGRVWEPGPYKSGRTPLYVPDGERVSAIVSRDTIAPQQSGAWTSGPVLVDGKPTGATLHTGDTGTIRGTPITADRTSFAAFKPGQTEAMGYATTLDEAKAMLVAPTSPAPAIDQSDETPVFRTKLDAAKAAKKIEKAGGGAQVVVPHPTKKGAFAIEPRPEATPKQAAARAAASDRWKKANADRRRPNPAKDSLNEWIAKRGGITLAERMDITGDDKNRAYNATQWLFRNGGEQVDELASRAHEDGYLTDEEINDVDGGVAALKARIREEFDGHKLHHSTYNGAAFTGPSEGDALMKDAYRLRIDDTGMSLDQIRAAVQQADETEATIAEAESNEEARLEREAIQADNILSEEDYADLADFESIEPDAQAAAGSDAHSAEQAIGENATDLAQVAEKPAARNQDSLELEAQSPEEARLEAERIADIAAREAADETNAAARQRRAANKAEQDRRAAEIIAEREAAKKAEVDALAAQPLELGQEAPAPVVKKVTPTEAAGQEDLFSQPANTLSPADLLRAAAAKMDEQAKPKEQGPAPSLANNMKQAQETGPHDDPSAAEAQMVQAAVEGKTIVDAARFIAESAPSEDFRLIGQRVLVQLQNLIAAGMQFEFHVAHIGEQVPIELIGTRGLTLRLRNSETTQVWVQGADVGGLVGASYEVVLHELLHAATQTAIYVGARNIATGTKLQENVTDLYAVTVAIQRHLSERIAAVGNDFGKLSQFEEYVARSLNNATASPGEIVSWALTNRAMQTYLDGIQVKGKNLWSEFVSAIRKFLGLPEKSESALSEVLRITDNLLDTPAVQLLSMADQIGMPTQINRAGGMVNNTAAQPEPKPPAPLFSRGQAEQPAPIFYSELARKIDALNMKIAPAAGWKEVLRGLVKKGVKQAEIDATGINDWLDLQGAKVTKEQVSNFLAQNGVQVTETELGNSDFTSELRAERDALLARESSLSDREAARLADLNAIKNGFGVEAGRDPKHSLYQLPGGENYRELLLRLPDTAKIPDGYRIEKGPEEHQWLTYNRDGMVIDDHTTEAAARESVFANYGEKQSVFRSSHFDQPNVLAHIRFNERTDAQGKRVLFVEEFQSDWAQKGKKEGFTGKREGKLPSDMQVRKVDREEAEIYGEQEGSWALFDSTNEMVVPVGPGTMTEAAARRAAVEQATDAGVALEHFGGASDSGVPSAPFVTKTEAWVALSLKRMIRYAAENGFDRVAWTTGIQQINRYPEALRQVADHISWKASEETNREVQIKKNGELLVRATVSKDGKVLDSNESKAFGKDLSELIGKPMAERVLNEQSGEIAGKDFTVGGKGMQDFYDKIVPNVANDVLKKLGGGRVGEVQLDTGKHVEYSVGRRDGDRRYGVTRRGMQEPNSYHYTLDEAMAERDRLSAKPPATAQPSFDITPEMREAALGGQALFNRGNESAAGGITGITEQTLRSEIAKAFSEKVADRIIGNVLIPLADQTQLPAHVVPFVRQGDTVYGFYDDKTDKTYAVLSNLNAENVRGLVMHELGVHYGFEKMLGATKYAKVMKRLDAMVKMGNKDAIEARTNAEKESVNAAQVPQETLAYLVQNRPTMNFVKEIIAAIKAFLFREFGIGANKLTADDLASLARGSVQRAGMERGVPSFAPAFAREAPSLGALTNDPSPEEAIRVQVGIEGKSAIDAAQFIVKTAPTKDYKLIALRVAMQLRRLEAAGMGFNLKVAHLGEPVHSQLAGQMRGITWRAFGSKETDIWVQGADVTGLVGVSYETVLHELLHAVTQSAIYIGQQPGNAALHKDIADLEDVHKAIQNHFNQRISGKKVGELDNRIERIVAQGHNSLRDLGEVVSWGLTNRSMQEYLESIPYQGGNLWTRFVSAIRKFLGLPVSADTTLSEILRITDRLLNAPVQQLLSVEMPTQINFSGGLLNNSRADEAAEGTPPATKVTMPKWAESESPEVQAALKKAGVIIEEKTLGERARELRTNFGKIFRQGLVDQFDPIKELGHREYMLARLTKATDGGLEAMMLYGKLKLDSGALNIENKDGGVLGLLQTLQGEHDRFFAWIAGNRAAQLKLAGKENLFTDDDISALKELNLGKMPDGTSRQAQYFKTKVQFDGYAKSVLDIAEQTGLIDRESRKIWEKDFYVPFYRVMEDGVGGPSISSGLVNQYAFKKLKGGSEGLHDLLGNTLQNWSHLLSASMRNQAARASLEAAAKLGVATEIPEKVKGSVAVLVDGKQHFYEVNDPFLLDAITSMEFSGFGGSAMKALATFKRWLTTGVTVNPAFRIRNIIRDSVAAIAQSDIGYNPIKNIATGWKATSHESEVRAQAMAGGGIIRFGTMLEGNRAEHVKRLIESGVHENTILDKQHKVVAMLQKAWDYYQEQGDRSENANRVALYMQLRERGMDHLEASYQARDMLDFSMGGQWAAIRFLTQTVPFMNARLQGLYKLGRAAQNDPKRMAYVVGAVTLASLALFLWNHDDDDWKKREEWDRDSYWWFKVGGVAFRIPKPFEIGAVASIAERVLEAFTSDERDPGKRFAKSLGGIISNNLSMNPVPQIVKPLIDLYANKDSFTGRDIETQGMERLSKDERIGGRTSLPAQLLAMLDVSDQLSPVQIDFMIRAYFGWVGSSAMTALDYGMRPMAGKPDKPAMKLKDVFLAGNFVETLPTNSSRYVTQFYDQAKVIEEAYADYHAALKVGDREKATGIRESEGDKIVQYHRTEQVKRALGKINEKERLIEANRTYSTDTKRGLLDALDAQKNRLTEGLAR
jgi:hypothetical protein